MLIFCLFSVVLSFKSEVYRVEENLLLYNSSAGLNKDIFTSEPITQICTLKKQFYTKFQQTFSIRSRQGFFNVEAFTTAKEIQVTGIGTAKYNPQLDEYQSKVKILTSCKAEQSLVTYTLGLKLISSNQTTIIQLPVGLSCYPEAYNVKIQYIILQFLSGILFIILCLIYSNISAENLHLKYQPLFAILFLTLPLIEKAPYLFVFFVTTIFMQKLLFSRLTWVAWIRLITLSLLMTGGLLWIEMSFSLYSHYFLNIMTIYVGFISFRAVRFRHIIVMLVLFVYLIEPYKRLIGGNTNLLIVLEALFKNQTYECVHFSLWNMIFPLIPSVFIIRSFSSPPTKNLHVLFHFIAYLGIGLFESLSKMSGLEIKSMVETTSVVIVVSSCFLSLIQGNFATMVQFKDVPNQN